jgi:hypothetical protein
MNKFFVIFLLIAVPLASFGQFVPGQGDDNIPVQPNITPKRSILKISVLAPLEIPKSIRAGLEVTLSDRFSIEPEIGYIFSYNSGVNRLKSNMVSMDQRLALRYYVPEDAINGLYIAPLVTFSSLNYERGTWRNLVPNQPDSTWFLDYANAAQFQQINIGTYAVGGMQTVIVKHITVDVCGGFGMHIQTTITKFSPEISKGQSVPAPVTTVFAEGLFSVHVGYVF